MNGLLTCDYSATPTPLLFNDVCPGQPLAHTASFDAPTERAPTPCRQESGTARHPCNRHHPCPGPAHDGVAPVALPCCHNAAPQASSVLHVPASLLVTRNCPEQNRHAARQVLMRVNGSHLMSCHPTTLDGTCAQRGTPGGFPSCLHSTRRPAVLGASAAAAAPCVCLSPSPLSTSAQLPVHGSIMHHSLESDPLPPLAHVTALSACSLPTRPPAPPGP